MYHKFVNMPADKIHLYTEKLGPEPKFLNTLK